MPWRDEARAIVESWYSGNVGGRAIAEVLSGAVNPSGRLPVTFYDGVEQTPHPVMPGFGTPTNTPTVIDYHEDDCAFHLQRRAADRRNRAARHGNFRAEAAGLQRPGVGRYPTGQL